MNTAFTNATTVAPSPSLSNGVKLDRCPLLNGSDNYELWAQKISYALRAMGIYEFVIEGNPKYTDPTAANMKSQAYLVYMQAVSDNIFDQVSRMQDPHATWNYLRATYQRNSSSSLVSQMRKISELQTSTETTNPQTFIEKFEHEWSRMSTLAHQTSTVDYRLTLRSLYNSDLYKRDMLLASFEKSHPHVVDTLKVKDNLTFNSAKEWLLDLQPVQPTFISASPAATTSATENCTWCKKHSPHDAAGHTYKNCSNLKEHKK